MHFRLNYADGEHAAWAQPHGVFKSFFLSAQFWLQCFLSPATVHWHAGCAHFFGSF